MPEKRDQMMTFWTQRSREHGRDPRANTNDVHLRELEITHISRWLQSERPASVLDFGCANGFTTLRLAQLHSASQFTGLDLNPDMIETARAAATEQRATTNVRFVHADILAKGLGGTFDFIFAVRVFQNIESTAAQRRAAEILIDALRPGGVLLYIESYLDEYLTLNEDRAALGLSPLPIHSHLTLLTPEFDSFVGQKLELVARESPSSSYYLITRLIYSALAKERNEPIDYDHPLHRLAAKVPQVGNYGPQYACAFRKADGAGGPPRC